MKNLIIGLLTIVFIVAAHPIYLMADSTLLLKDLRTEYKVNPIGIGDRRPRLSWKIVSDRKNLIQSAYQIQAAFRKSDLQKGVNLIWDSGKVESDQSVHIKYKGPDLKSRQRVYWRVRVWDSSDEPAKWSDINFWEMGLLNPADWKVAWIQANLTEDTTKSNPAQMLRTTFNLEGEIGSARAYVSCQGLYEMEINGNNVGDQLFTPGWTSYNKRLQYQTYDITDLLKTGENGLGVYLGDGWYRGRIGWEDHRNHYGKKLALLVQIHITYQDGSREIIGTDQSWKATTGPIRVSDIYDGEIYDARLEKPGWSEPGYDDGDWKSVSVVEHPKNVLVAPEGPPVKKIEEIEPKDIFTTPEGDTVVDMGQNMVGFMRMKVKGKRGQTITLTHAEVLDKNGNFYTKNLRSAKQQIKYTLKGSQEEIYEPYFTFQGFRYVKVEGWPGELSKEDLTGVVVHSDMEPTGDFVCSNPMINQLQHNIQWGQKGNFLDVPTDCPQRDERLGWTGDAQVFARTACFNMDAAAFYTKWLKDLAADQEEKGQVPHVVPDVLGGNAAAGWADAAVIIPWTIYLCYGDTRILEEQYSSMKAWVDYMKNRAGDSYFWNTDFTFGDWLAFSTDRPDYPGATTDKDFITQAYFGHSTDILIKTAKILGKSKDVEQYAKLLAKIKEVFQKEFVTPADRLSPNTQTAYTLALGFDLLADSTKPGAAQRLAQRVREFEHITTGFLGTPLLCHILSDYGYYEEAYMLLNRKEYPSWLYPITMGATTIWERWDGIKPDSTFQTPDMNSFNHYAYGAIGDWLYRVVAGINIDKQNPGYKHSLIHPHPGGELTSAKAHINTMYGQLASGWKIENGTIKVNLVIPPNTTSTVTLPRAKADDIRNVDNVQEMDNKVKFDLGSGNYEFEYAW